jgi:hypothetical protein
MLLAVRAIKTMHILPDLDTQSRFGHPGVAHKQNHLEMEHARVARSEISNKTALIPGPSGEVLQGRLVCIFGSQIRIRFHTGQPGSSCLSYWTARHASLDSVDTRTYTCCGWVHQPVEIAFHFSGLKDSLSFGTEEILLL